MGSHLFDPRLLESFKDQNIVMIEDYGLFTHFRYHQLKVAFLIEAMRNYRDLLKSLSFKISYHELNKKNRFKGFVERLGTIITRDKVRAVTSFSIEDIFLREQLEAVFSRLNVRWIIIESPMFLNSEAMIKDALPARLNISPIRWDTQFRHLLNIPCHFVRFWAADNGQPLQEEKSLRRRNFQKIGRI